MRVRGGHPLCVDLKRCLSATTSLDLNRILSLARITRISFKKQLDLEASAAAVDRLVVKGSSSFLAVGYF